MEALNRNLETLHTIGPGTVTPDHVRGLSLSTVTKQYQSLGLYVRMIDSLNQNGMSNDPNIQLAVNLGMSLHANDRRSDGHYTDHLMRVTLRMLDHFSINDPHLIAAGPLHDSLEDHPKDLVFALSGEKVSDKQEARFIGHTLLSQILDPEIADLVWTVTNPIVEDPEDKIRAYLEHTQHIVYTSPKGRVLKLADFIDNAVGNHHTKGAKRERLDRKYVDAYRIHKLGLFLPDSLITGHARNDVLTQLTRGHMRAMARLAVAET